MVSFLLVFSCVVTGTPPAQEAPARPPSSNKKCGECGTRLSRSYTKPLCQSCIDKLATQDLMKDLLKTMREEMAAVVQSFKTPATVPLGSALEGADDASTQDTEGLIEHPSLWDNFSIPSTQVREQEDPEEGSSCLKDSSSSEEDSESDSEGEKVKKTFFLGIHAKSSQSGI